MIPISACANQPPECLRTCKVKLVIIQDKNLHPSRTGKAVVAHFEFLTASSMVDGVILRVAVLQAERRISRYEAACNGIPSARSQKGGLFGMTNEIQIHTKPLPGKAGFVTGTRRSHVPSYNSDYEPWYRSMCVLAAVRHR